MRLHNTALILAIAALALAGGAQSVTTTTVQGTVYLAGGAPASGSLQLSWPAFTTAAGQAIAAGHSNTTIGHDGFVSVNLAPNIGASPAGLYYTAIYHLSDGSTSTEYWVVPAAASASLAQVRAQVMPAAQAVQAVSKGYVDLTIQELTQSLLTSSGGNLTGPLYLSGDPSVPTQAATKRYVDSEFAQALPLGGGNLRGPVTATQIGAVFQADQASGADFGAKLQSCINRLDPTYGGVCDARNFSGALTMAANLNIAISNATIYLPCSTIATAASILVPAGVRNITLHGCASRGTSAASGSQGGTVFLYSGASTLLQVGDPTYAADTNGFHLDNLVVNTTAASAATAQAIALYRTQEASLSSLYLLGNSNQTALTLDGTGNYTGGTFQDLQISGFLTAVNAIGHQVSNPATTDWLNASTFLRLHIDCHTSSGNPIAGTTGINLLSGDGNTFTGGDVENCSTALHLGPSAQNNTLIGLRNENSTTQIQADSGSAYNNWITGGTMFTGKLVDNGTRNSFLDTFHRSFNGISGDWYGSQQDATLTNHFRLGIGSGNERGLLNRYQTDSGYRWTTGLSDASAGAQFYQVLDELNNVYRLSIGQYNPGQSSSNNQTVLNSAGTGAILLNGSSNAGTGGVVFGSGGPSSSTVATVDKSGNANFTGTLQVGGVTQSTGTLTVRNNADSEVDYYLWPGATASQKGSLTYKDFNGASQWYLVKDTSNNLAINSAIGGLDSFKAYQSTNSGDTYINASNSTGHIRLNYESGAGAETDIYSGSSSSLAAAFLNPTSIKLPGLAATSGHNCLQIDNSGYLSNAGQSCGTATTVASAGLAFSDASVQTTSQQGALTGQANDATARSTATAAQSTATAAQSAVTTEIARAQAAESAAQSTATAAQSAVTTETARAQAAESAAQSTANAALPASGGGISGSLSVGATITAGSQTLPAAAPSGTIAATVIYSPKTGIDPRAYGAVFDGIADDTPALTAAINAACASATGKLLLPAGTSIFQPGLPLCSNLTISGQGQGVTILRVKPGFGNFIQMFGVEWGSYSNIGFANLTLDYKSQNNEPTSLTQPRFIVSTASGSSGLVFDHVTVLNINAMNAIFSGSVNAVIANCIFALDTTGTLFHDHSTLYIAANGAAITSNQFIGGINAPGSATAIETHGGQHSITGNVINGYFAGMNITGVSATDSETISISGNTIDNAYGGIQLWSWQYTGHTTGYGLAGVSVTGNNIRLRQTSWSLSPGNGNAVLGNPSGIWINCSSNLPLKTILVADNTIEFDLESSPAAPFGTLTGMGIGYNDAAGNSIDGFKIANNVIRNANLNAIVLAVASASNVTINGNHIVNPGSSANPNLNAAYRSGIFIGQGVSSLRINNNDITDNQSTSRMVQALAFYASALTDAAAINNTVSVTGGTRSSFTAPVAVSSATQVPFVSLLQNTPAFSGATVNKLAQGSSIVDPTSGVTWYINSAGTGWIQGQSGTSVLTPFWLQYLGTGADGSYTAAATATLYGEYYFNNFTVPAASVVTASSVLGLVVHATGTCTIAGTINMRGQDIPASPGYAGGSAGGSGGGSAAGSAGSNTAFPMAAIGLTTAQGGSAGTASGGTGAPGATPSANLQRAMVASLPLDGLYLSGAPGKAGANSGGAAGNGGGGVTLICGKITGTDGANVGAINVSGSPGGNAPANSTGAGSGGGGGVILLSSQSPVATLPTLSVLGGNGGTCASYTTCGAGGNGGNGWFAEFSGW